MITNLIEPHVLNRKRGDSKLQHMLGAGARRVRHRPHLHFLDQQPLNDQGIVSMGACLYCACPNPHSNYLMLKIPLTPGFLLLVSM